MSVVTQPPGGVIGVVPVQSGDPSAPSGCGALRVLHARTLVARAVEVLDACEVVDRVVVVCPQPVLEAVSAAVRLGGTRSVPVTMLAVEPTGPRGPGLADLLAAALDGLTDPDAVVVLHDPLHPLAPSTLVQLVVSTLLAADGRTAVVPMGQVTDTLKWVDDEDRVLGTADRTGYRMAYTPQAYRAGMVRQALATATPAEQAAGRLAGADTVPRIVQSWGGRILSVPAPGEVFRIASADDLLLAEAMLQGQTSR